MEDASIATLKDKNYISDDIINFFLELTNHKYINNTIQTFNLYFFKLYKENMHRKATHKQAHTSTQAHTCTYTHNL
jgi:Ulp1 family protease